MQQLTFQAPDLNTTTLGEAGVTTVFKLVDGSYEGSDEIPFKQLNVDTIIEFELPAGTGGSCGLDLNFDKGYKLIHQTGAMRQMEVWNVDDIVTKTNPGPDGVTWNNAPRHTTLFGRIRDIELPQSIDGGYEYSVRIRVQSRPCQSKMTFRVTVAGDVEDGGLEFRQEEEPSGGWLMRYNC